MSSPKVGKRVSNTQLGLNPTPDHLRTLVLDYLCHNCNTKTARAFARDSAVRHLDADGDEIHPDGLDASSSADLTNETLRLVDLRQQIRIHILSGRVDEATTLLNEHFPLVLAEADPPVRPRSSIQSDHVEYVAPTSVDPTHLSLNLRILAFSEASRTVPLDYMPHAERTTAMPSAHPPQAFKSSVHDHDDPAAKQTELLFRAQKLYSAAGMLKNPSDRARYLKELGNVGGLLAYKHPENSPMAKYLSQERREAVAEQINAAILYGTGRPAISNLELYTRHTTVLWEFLSKDPRVRPTAKRPAGVMLPPTGRESNDNLPTSGGSEKETWEILPSFDLRHLLDSRV